MAYDPRLRMQFFTGQFLEEQDFNDLQDYHLDRQRRHNKTMHIPGIADGLDVNQGDGLQIKITPGTAIDGEGRQIILPSDDSRLLDSFKKKTVFIVVSYKEDDSTSAPYLQDGKPTRKIETANIEVVESIDGKPPNLFIQLASIEVSDNSINIKKDVRVNAGAKGAGAELKTKLDNHIADVSNPHQVTLDQIGAKGGAIAGPLKIQTANPGRYTGTNPTIRDRGATFIVNTAQDSYGLVAKLTSSDVAMPTINTPKDIPAAAIVAITEYSNTYAICAVVQPNQPAIWTNGKTQLSGVNTGHITDSFINASGQRLRMGDVVKLKGTPVARFRASSNKIPIAEVTLADRENDSSVIGIVEGEAFPEPGMPDTRVEPEDPSFIENGGELHVVTSGVFSYCKVDATTMPIEVGDLLTTSNNPGHAQKATEPKLGSIIGKALEPFAQGIGQIAVFVNLH